MLNGMDDSNDFLSESPTAEIQLSGRDLAAHAAASTDATRQRERNRQALLSALRSAPTRDIKRPVASRTGGDTQPIEVLSMEQDLAAYRASVGVGQ